MEMTLKEKLNLKAKLWLSREDEHTLIRKPTTKELEYLVELVRKDIEDTPLP